MKKFIYIFMSAVTAAAILTGCGSSKAPEQNNSTSASQSTAVQSTLEDGVYTAEFDTDSSMFHVNESKDGKGELTVKDGKMSIHVSLASKNIVNLYLGTADNAKNDKENVIQPTTDKVKYSDGYEEEVYGFDIPVPELDKQFDVALIGTKGTWYDHKVSVSNPQPIDKKASDTDVKDGKYKAEIKLEGGSGRADIKSPTDITVKDGKITAKIIWSSPNYDYMMVNDKKYEPINKKGNSEFKIPVSAFDEAVAVSADTTAMSQPHLIDYTITIDSGTIKER